jgi:hypothetical protein
MSPRVSGGDGSPTKVLGDDITTKKFIQPRPANFLNVFLTDYLNANFGLPLKFFFILKGIRALARKIIPCEILPQFLYIRILLPGSIRVRSFLC